MAILVTGGMGFIGSNFIWDWLDQSDEKIINLDKLTYAGNPENLADLQKADQHIFIKDDICNTTLLQKIFTEYSPRAVVHFAAESHVDRSISNPKTFIDTNVTGTFHLLEVARIFYEQLSQSKKERFRFLHISTDEVYGSLKKNAPAFTEHHPYLPNSPYSASKAASDHLVRAYYHTYNLPVLISNCSNNFGPFQHPEKLIPLTINNCLKARSIPIYGSGSQVRDWLYVGDHCRALRLILEEGKVGESYNIGGLNEKKNIDIVTHICDLLKDILPPNHAVYKTLQEKDFSRLITHVEDRPGHDYRYAMNIDKISAELNWEPQEDFTTSLQKTIKWYLK